jgi:hypothetical protein
MHHSKTDIFRLYIKRKEEEEACYRMKRSYKAEIINIAEYLNNKYEYKKFQYLNTFNKHENNQPNKYSTNKNSKCCIRINPIK